MFLQHLFVMLISSRCFARGAEVVTMPVKVFDSMYKHVLTREGLDLFQKDWESIKEVN